VRRVSRETRACCIGVELDGVMQIAQLICVMQIAQLICHLRYLRSNVQEAPSKNLARVVFRAEPTLGLFGGTGQAQPMTLRFDQPPSQMLLLDPLLEEA
jgi:hypothetical protein